jgi:hypothetical protein
VTIADCLGVLAVIIKIHLRVNALWIYDNAVFEINTSFKTAGFTSDHRSPMADWLDNWFVVDATKSFAALPACAKSDVLCITINIVMSEINSMM